MAQNSKIEWTNATWNPVTGCTKISDGCRNCYAERMAKRLQAMGKPQYRNGFQLAIHPSALDIPLRVYDRLPGYLRERRGVIDEHIGSFGNPEELAAGSGDAPGAHLYRVRFRASELWGADAESPDDELCADLFQHYT